MTTQVKGTSAGAPWTSKRPQPEVEGQYSPKNKPKTYTIQKGNTLWDVAKSGLQSNSVKATNEEIMKELERLTKLNDCESIDELAKKCSKIGSVVKLSGGDRIPESHLDDKAKAKGVVYTTPNPFAATVPTKKPAPAPATTTTTKTTKATTHKKSTAERPSEPVQIDGDAAAKAFQKAYHKPVGML